MSTASVLIRRPLLVAAVGLLALSASASALGRPSPTSALSPQSLVNACAPASRPGVAHCLAVVKGDADGVALAAPRPDGLGPDDLVSAYRLPTGAEGAGHTVAVVDAFNDPNAEADLAVYRRQYGLPPCTTDNGCFQQVSQRGGTDYPPDDPGWAMEEALDLDMVSAVCPACHILLVEADDPFVENLAVAVDEAARLGATEISNSYGAFEFPEERDFEASYHHPGVAVVAASGDFAYGVQFPAASRYVTAVGGTTLVRTSGRRGWAERAWSGAGSRCSAYIAKPSWQRDTLCPTRTVADVAAVADPVTGVAAYDSFGIGGWFTAGGTSAASPIVAGIYALAGKHPDIDGASPVYRHADQLVDVTAWANGFCGNYLCRATTGFDGPTGLGTPSGTGDFR